MRGKLSADFFNIKEERRGGDRFDYPAHESNITEAVNHDITTGAMTFDLFTREAYLWSVYFSGQQSCVIPITGPIHHSWMNEKQKIYL